MKPPIPPNDESQRLAALQQYQLLDTLPEAALDELTTLAAHICGAPIALVSVIDTDRQWFKSRFGLALAETPRDVSFCAHAILQPGIFVVPDAAVDERFADNPLVTGEPKIRFYAGAPLITPAGHALGTLCIIDRAPREMPAAHQEALGILSRQVMAQLESRRQAFELAATGERLRLALEAAHLGAEKEELSRSQASLANAQRIAKIGNWDLDLTALKLSWSDQIYEIFGITKTDFGANYEAFISRVHPQDRDRMNAAQHAALAGEARLDVEHRIVLPDGTVKTVHELGDLTCDAQGRPVRLSGTVQDVTERRQADLRIQQLNRVHSVLSAINQNIVRETNPQAMLAGACRIAVEKGWFRMAWIGLSDGPGGSLRIAAHAGGTEDTVGLVRSMICGQHPDCSFTFQALQTGRPAACNDIAHDPKAAWWREAALKREYRAMASLPLQGAEGVIGTLNLYADKPGFFDAEELGLLEELATDIGFGLEVRVREAERRRVDRSLRESEERFRQLADHVDEVFWITDAAKTQILFVSPAYEAVWGRSCASLRASPRSWIESIHPDDRERVLLAATTKQVAGTYDEEFRILRPDGELRWIRDQAYPVADATGQVHRVVGTARDITERKQSETTLRLNEEKFHNLFESSPDAIIVASRGGAIRAVNRQAERLFGYERQELIGGQIERLMSPDFSAAHVDLREKYADNPHPRAMGEGRDLFALRRDGTEFPVDISLSPITTPEGMMIISTIRDVSARKRADTALRESRQMLEKAQQIGRIGSWVSTCDSENGLLWSAETCRIFGFAPGDFDGWTKTFLDRVHPEDLEALKEAWQAALAGERSYDLEHRIRRRDGQLRWVHEQADVERDGRGRPVRLVGVVQDITDRRQLEDQFRQSQKMEAIGQLAGGVAHDFNNILAAMMMQAELACLEQSLPPGTRKLLQEMRKSIERAANLTGQLLAFSRRRVMQSRLLDLNDIVSQLTNMLERILGEDVRLELKLHPGPLSVRADAGMLDQVLLNLVVNARDAMPGGGQLTIETGTRLFTAVEAAAIPDAKPGPHVSVRIADTGSGIAPENLPRIFEPFFTTKESGKGTGLGLATVFGVVKQHGGSLAVESEIGQGTSFQFFLPAAEISEPTPALGAARRKLVNGTETILLVEDEPEVRGLTRNLLERQGYRVLEAGHGVAALRVWEQHDGPIHLLFTDLVMPEGVDGRELALRLLERCPQLRVIFTSGYSADIAGRQLVLRAGQHFLQKPCPPDQILETVRQCLDG